MIRKQEPQSIIDAQVWYMQTELRCKGFDAALFRSLK